MEDDFVCSCGPSILKPRPPLPKETIEEIKRNVAKLPPLSKEEFDRLIMLYNSRKIDQR